MLGLVWHSDRHAGSPRLAEAESRTTYLNIAWDLLREHRTDYDDYMCVPGAPDEFDDPWGEAVPQDPRAEDVSEDPWAEATPFGTATPSGTPFGTPFGTATPHRTPPPSPPPNHGVWRPPPFPPPAYVPPPAFRHKRQSGLRYRTRKRRLSIWSVLTVVLSFTFYAYSIAMAAALLLAVVGAVLNARRGKWVSFTVSAIFIPLVSLQLIGDLTQHQ